MEDIYHTNEFKNSSKLMNVKEMKESTEKIDSYIKLNSSKEHQTIRKPQFFRQSSSILFQDRNKIVSKKQSSSSLFKSRFNPKDREQNSFY
jgi:hypothetical protein